jgi:hypothetical protein
MIFSLRQHFVSTSPALPQHFVNQHSVYACCVFVDGDGEQRCSYGKDSKLLIPNLTTQQRSHELNDAQLNTVMMMMMMMMTLIYRIASRSKIVLSVAC